MMRALTHNLAWKLASLAASIILWLGFNGAQELSTTVAAPVQYRNLPAHLEISSDVTDEIHVHLRGPSTRLANLSGGAVPVVIDLSEIKTPGERTFNVGVQNISLPAGVRLERAIPSQLRLTLEDRATAEVPVVARFNGLPPGWRVREAVVEPSHLKILGPASRVARLYRVETDPVDLSQPKRQVEARTQAFAGDPQVNFVGSSVVTVRVILESSGGGR